MPTFRIRLSSWFLAIALALVPFPAMAAKRPGVPAAVATPPVATSPETIQPLKVGDTVPDVRLTNADGLEFGLRKLIKNQPSVLIFYRGGWCVYCNTQLGELKGIEVPLQKLGYQIIAISPDKVEKVRESLKKYNLSYLLVSDSAANAIKAFGLAYQVDDAACNKMK